MSGPPVTTLAKAEGAADMFLARGVDAVANRN
jgi:hypothetical protein